MTSPTWSVTSRRDLTDARQYLSTFDEQAADRLVDQAIAAGEFIAAQPLAGSDAGSRGARKWRIGRTPYLILYRPRSSGILILRVIHAARDWTRFLS